MTTQTNTTKIETWLPLFPGFYNTLFEPDYTTEIDNINNERSYMGFPPITFDDCIFDTPSYFNEMASKACGYIEKELNNVGIKCKIEFQHVNSPKYYNYTTDEIAIEIELDLTAVKNMLIENKEILSQYFKDKYTSCDGFISHYSNDINDWINDFDNADKHTHKIGSILEALLTSHQQSEANTESMYDHCNEGYITASNYHDLIHGVDTIKN